MERNRTAGEALLWTVVRSTAKMAALIGSSVAGLAVALGSYGFLVEIAHYSKLGIPLGKLNALELVARGGITVAETVCLGLFDHGLAYEVIPGLLALAAVGVVFSKLPRLAVWRGWAPRVAAMLVLISVQILVLVRLLRGIVGADSVFTRIVGKDFLFIPIDDTQINREIVKGAKGAEFLERFFGAAAASVLIVAAALAYVYWTYFREQRHEAGGGYRVLTGLRGISVVLLSISLICLPMLFGSVVVKYDYPLVEAYEVSSSGAQPNSACMPPKSFLVNEDDETLIVYHSYHTVWLNRKTLAYVVIGPPENVFAGRTLHGGVWQ
jgi:hypothetical protein